MVNASDPSFRLQLKVVHEVLAEVGVEDSKLHQYIIEVSQQEMIEEEILVPYTIKGISSEIRSTPSVTKE